MGQETEMIPAWVEGVLTPVGKIEAHLDGLRHRAVSVFVLDGPRLLIQRRAMGKYHTPGLWANTCCTHPHWGEPPRDCAIRRLSQELGISGLVPSFIDQVEYRADVGGGMVEHELVDLFITEARPGLTISPNPAEVMATDWVDIHILAERIERQPEIFTPWLRIYMAEHRDALFGMLESP